MKLSRLVPLLALLVAPFFGAVTHADDAPAAAASPADAELARLRGAQGHSVKWNDVPQGHVLQYTDSAGLRIRAFAFLINSGRRVFQSDRNSW